MQTRRTPTAPAADVAAAAAAAAAAAEAKTGTTINDSRAQPEGLPQTDLVLEPTNNKFYLTGGPVSSLGLTEEEMESELASIETQRRLVMLARRLATAREEQARGFPSVEVNPTTTASRPRESAAESADSAREANTSKEEAQLLVPKISMFTEVFKNHNNIRQRSGESVDSLVDRINALEKQMPTQPEEARVRTLMYALHVSTRDMILKRQAYFATRNELQKLAVELEAFDAKQHLRDRGWRNDGRGGQQHTDGGSHAPSRVSKGRGKSPFMGAKGGTPRSERRGKNKDLSHIICYHCERPGHYASNCPGHERSGKERA